MPAKFRNILSAAAALIGLSAFAANSVQPLNVSELAAYVYPNNSSKSPKAFTYMPDGQSYLILADDHRTIGRFDTRSGNFIENVFDVDNTRETTVSGIEGFTLSPDGSKILVYNNSESVYRRSFTAAFYVYELRTRIMRPLSADHKIQRSPVFSPDGRMVAFAAPDNNIYIKKIDYNTEVAVTTDGKVNCIINGTSDWVYEEEFSTTCSMTWSPDNLMLCYIKFNETDVPTYSLPLYQTACQSNEKYALYPGEYSYKYPVAGEKNSVVTLHSYDVETRKTIDLPLNDNRIEYIPRIAFAPIADATRLMVVTLNREQNLMNVLSVNPRSTVVKSVLTEESKAWITCCSYEDICWQPDGFVINSARTGYNHLYKYSYTGTLLRTITSGDFDVTDYYGSDAQGNEYYQTASPMPADRTVQCIDKKGKIRILGKDSGGTTSASFDPSMAYCVLNFSDVTTPPQFTLNTSAGKQLRVLEDNSELAARFSSAMASKKFFTMTNDGYTLYGYRINPPNFNPAEKYPVIIYQYSGPDSQSVRNRWELDWQIYAAKCGYIIICVDGRGTGCRGRDFAQCVYKRLGHFETIDQLAAARHAATLEGVDPQRIGICGWSFGGYETLLCASADTHNLPYSAAVAIAPVTSWRYYDSIYTERYMLTPAQNYENYISSAPISHVRNLNIPLLIMYGTSDDNVHPANSIEYISRLQINNKFCDQWIFPGMNHSILGCNARAMVYGNMLRFFNHNL